MSERRAALIVDDSQTIRAMLALGLARMLKVDTIPAGTARDAIQTFDWHCARLCLVVLDLMLPDSPGYEGGLSVMRHIQQHPAGSAIPVVAISALSAGPINNSPLAGLPFTDIIQKDPRIDLTQAITARVSQQVMAGR